MINKSLFSQVPNIGNQHRQYTTETRYICLRSKRFLIFKHRQIFADLLVVRIGGVHRQYPGDILTNIIIQMMFFSLKDRQKWKKYQHVLNQHFLEDTIPASISDLVVEIQSAASNLGKGLNQDAAYELADMVRVMNCYYSNLIEGHNTRPKDIERALAGAEIEEATRPLALEARAHVIVQREIDRMALNSALPIPTSTKFISWVHRRFYEKMPDEFRFVEHNDGTKVAIVPGEFRADIKDDVSSHPLRKEWAYSWSIFQNATKRHRLAQQTE